MFIDDNITYHLIILSWIPTHLYYNHGQKSIILVFKTDIMQRAFAKMLFRS